ncbi:uncharacterized protein LOC114744212 [Neltuma alba]|uniref:uncharacterized protein LOC114744212 n=1 Tax=Neltuma alba TaxID=207710 RepID=UPI0010A338D8|nr:uncharacterized protein LOC114744212 [Prosopis alba]
MESIPAELVKNETQSLVNLVKNGAQYICCFNSYVQEYEQAKERLKAKLEDVRRIIDQARGVSFVTSGALQWTHEVEKLIDVDTKKEKCFNDLCLNCWPQYQKGRDLAKGTLDIDRLLKRCNFDIVAGSTDFPGIKYHCLPNFTYFESRKSIFKELKKALEDEENNMIGLEGLGGTGKTSMATEVGAELEGSTFSKVIFLVVSKLPDFKHLRGEIARRLGLKSEDGEYRKKILTKIKALKEKLLIVLDDVWMEFDLRKELGIPPPHLHKGCTILITTRSKEICKKMDCQRIIHLQALTDKEALQLFLEHANSSSTLENLAQEIVKHCHGVPVVILALARSLKDRPFKVWTEALRNLQSGESIFNVRDEDLKKVYEGLKLSYDNLRNEKSKKLLLISSLFPEDFNIPMEFLIRIGVGMGPFGKEVDDYNKRRRKSLDAVVELLGSSLLLNAERECVKMHDLVHEVALLIGQEDIQSIIKSELSVKKGLQCLYWKNDDFSRPFDSQNLEVLFLVRDDRKDLEVPDTFFREMTKLKVLFLQNKAWHRISAPSLFPLIQLLQDIRTLRIKNFNLHSNISMLGGLSNLETLWLDDCSIIKPEKKFELQKLRFLGIENCNSNMNNPFELIEACPKLEELAFLSNDYVKHQEEDTISQEVSLPSLQIYQISSEGNFLDYFKQYGSLSRCFQPGSLTHLISEATFRQLARTAELLSLSGHGKQKNLIPDIVPVDDTGMTDLIILQLDSWPDMQCLIDAVNNCFDVKNAFSNLVGLYLSKIGLSNILFNGHYNLCHLKTLKLKECPKLTSIFLPSTAQSLLHLEELNIRRCDALECIVEDQSSRGEIAGGDGDNDQKSYGTLFPKFKILEIDSCDNLEIILPILHGGWHLERIIIQRCKKLKYIFDKFQEVNVNLPFVERMQLVSLSSLVGVFRQYEKSTSSSPQRPAPIPSSTKIRSFSWGQVCCFKSKATSEEADVAVSMGRLLDKGISQGLLASKKWIDNAPTLGRQLALHVVGHIRKMELASLSSNSVSTLFTLSMASVIAWEELTISRYDGLKHLVMSEEDDYKDEINCSSIFPKLQKLYISECVDLEFLFLSAISIEIKNLKSLTIEGAPQLTYVSEKYQHQHRLSDQNQNDEWHFDLPALEVLCLEKVPKFIDIGPMNYKIVSPSLPHVCSDKAQLNLNTTKELDPSTCGVFPSHPAQSLLVQSLKNVRKIELTECENLISLSNLSVAASTISLKNLRIQKCHKLKCITTHEGDAQVVIKFEYCSIFPTLENLYIGDCEELEFVFQSSISGGLQKLKSLTIMKVLELKYIVGNYQQDQQNEELHFDLPALATLYIEDAPKIKSIGAKNYKMDLSSLQNVVMWNCGIKSLDDYDMVNLPTSEEVGASTEGVPPFLVAQSLLVQSLKNVTKIKLWKCGNILSLSTLSIAASTISLESLSISKCHKLKCITTHEGDAQVDNKNYCSIFPTLEKLEINYCRELEFVFQSSISGGLQKLKSLYIREVPELKYIVGNYQQDQQNEELHFELPALANLYIEDAPKIKSICAKNYKMDLASLQNVVMGNCGIKSFDDYDMVNVTTSEELNSSTGRVPPFHASQILLTQSLKNVRKIELFGCWNIISLSTLSLASTILLEDLSILNCHKLKCIVEDEADAGTHMSYNSIFPKLKRLEVSDCHALEYLFPAYAFTCPAYLESLVLKRAPMLKYVFGRNQHEDNITHQNESSKIHMDFPTLKDFSIEDAPEEKKKAPIHTSPNLTVLPTRDNTHASAKIFEKEEEEEDDLAVPPVTIISSEQTSEAILPLSPMSTKASTSLNQSLSTVLPKPSNGRNLHNDVESTNQQTSNVANDVQASHKSLGHATVSSGSGNIRVDTGGLITTRHRQSDIKAKNSFLKEKPKTSIHGDPFVPCMTTVSSEQTSKALLPQSPKSSKASLCKPTDDIKVSDKPPATVIGNGVPIPRPTTRYKGVNNDKDINETNVTQDESKTKMASRGGQPNSSEHVADDPSNLWQMEQELSCSRGQIKHPDVTKSSNINTEHAQSSLLPFSTPSDSAPSVLETDQALNISGVQEIVEMMKLEGSDTSLLEEALKTHPQLRLSTNDRSTQMLCVSYRVLIDILHILTTRTPFTITEADKRLLEEKLKDARFVGFDKDWLESIKTKVFNSDLSDFDGIQEIITGLDSDLKTNEAMLAASRNQEVKAAQVAEMAQKHLEAALQEDANVMANHTQLSKARQEILARQNQYREMIAAKNKHFGF